MNGFIEVQTDDGKQLVNTRQIVAVVADDEGTNIETTTGNIESTSSYRSVKGYIKKAGGAGDE